MRSADGRHDHRVGLKVTSSLQVGTPSDGVTLLRLHRPARLNALNEALVAELQAALAAIAADPGVRVVVVTGEGRGFCSGLDIRDFGPSLPDAAAPVEDRMLFQQNMSLVPQAFRDLPQPVVAAINGPAVGGGMALALACDVRICSTSASFANGAVGLGLSGGEMGMSYYLPRTVGLSVAADWMLTGRTVLAQEALDRGLVSQLFDDEVLLARALEVAATIAAHSTLGTQLTKRVLQTNADAPNVALALELENRNQVAAHATAEAAAARAKWTHR
jgi:enoyl-CoA hydratase